MRNSSPSSLAGPQTFADNLQVLDGTILFGGDFGLAGVGHSIPLDHGFLAPVDEDSQSQVRTGIAVANLEEETVDLELRLYESEGSQIDSARASLVARGHIARFVDDSPMPNALRNDASGSAAQLDDPFPTFLIENQIDRTGEEKDDLVPGRMHLPRRPVGIEVKQSFYEGMMKQQGAGGELEGKNLVFPSMGVLGRKPRMR